MINPENEMGLTDKKVAFLLANQIIHDSDDASSRFAVQIFIESLVLPTNCNHYTVEMMADYILKFMKKYELEHKINNFLDSTK